MPGRSDEPGETDYCADGRSGGGGGNCGRLVSASAHAAAPGLVGNGSREADQRRGAHGTEKRDISRARGAIHFRRSLLEDGSFDWERDTRGVRPQWDYLVRFEGDDGWATISFDLDENVAQLAGWDNRLIALSPRTAEGLKVFFAEQFSDDGAK